MASPIIYITEGARFFLTSWKNRLSPQKYKGSAQEICQSIVKDCWNGRFFQTSAINFKQFWTRDFGLCTQSLLKLKYEKEVRSTLRYALNRFKKHRQITTTITPGGKPYDFPTFAVDSLPWFIHSIKVSNFEYYEHKQFLNWQIKKFFEKVVDEKTGLVKKNEHFSSIKDFALRKSSCYDNCMVAMLAQDLASMKKLDNPFRKYDYSKLIKDHFWNGEYFYDDLTKKDYVAGDANLFPFLVGVVKDEKMLRSVINRIQQNELDQPFPLKYTDSRDKIKFVWQEMFFLDYESDAVWTHMGPLWIKLVQQVDKKLADEYRQKYKEMIEKHHGFLEVFSAESKPYSSPFYYCDRAMLWAANWLSL